MARLTLNESVRIWDQIEIVGKRLIGKVFPNTPALMRACMLEDFPQETIDAIRARLLYVEATTFKPASNSTLTPEQTRYRHPLYIHDPRPEGFWAEYERLKGPPPPPRSEEDMPYTPGRRPKWKPL